MAHQQDSDEEPRSVSSTTPVDDCFAIELDKAENMPKDKTLFMFVILATILLQVSALVSSFLKK
ncbi:hypothetical protein AYI97_13730 [Shewanella algae]|nr:hypothetical protein AYI97_13730 [Shewanella algae]